MPKLFALLLGVAIAATAPAQAEVKSPFDIEQQRALFDHRDAAFSCEIVAGLPHVIEAVGIYEETPTHSIVDPDKLARELKLEQPIRKAENNLGYALGELISAPSSKLPGVQECIIHHLLQFARDDAFVGTDQLRASGVVRLQSVTPVLAYVLIRDTAIADGNRREIEAWIRRLSDRLVYFEERFPAYWGTNISYASGAALALAAVALQNEQLLSQAVDIAKTATAQVTESGLLPKELARGNRALMYNLAAAQGLTIIAFVAKANGIDLLSYNDGALAKLLATLADSVTNPAVFIRKTGNAHATAPGMAYGGNLGWTAIYAKMTGSIVAAKAACRNQPLFSFRMGGDWFKLVGNPGAC